MYAPYYLLLVGLGCGLVARRDQLFVFLLCLFHVLSRQSCSICDFEFCGSSTFLIFFLCCARSLIFRETPPFANRSPTGRNVVLPVIDLRDRIRLHPVDRVQRNVSAKGARLRDAFRRASQTQSVHAAAQGDGIDDARALFEVAVAEGGARQPRRGRHGKGNGHQAKGEEKLVCYLPSRIPACIRSR
jgi:hypothetical protein